MLLRHSVYGFDFDRVEFRKPAKLERLIIYKFKGLWPQFAIAKIRFKDTSCKYRRRKSSKW